MSSNEDEPSNAPPRARARAKAPARRSGDDLSGNQVLENRTRDSSSRQPSKKQDLSDKENFEANQKKLDKLLRDAEKIKKQLSKHPKTAAPKPHDDNDLESEEQNDSGDDNGISFQSSIKQLAPLPAEPPRRTVDFRKLAKNQAPPKTSSRAFLTLPERPPGEDSPPPSPVRNNDGDDMEIDALATFTPHADDTPDNRLRPVTERDGHGHPQTPSSPSAGRDISHQGPAPSGASRKRPSPSSAQPPPPAKRKQKEPQFAEGYVTVKGAKPKAADYEPAVEALLIRAMAEYAMLIVTLNAFPDIGLQIIWAKTCFRHACRAANLYYSITERMVKLIGKRGSHVRSKIVIACRTLFPPHYKFNRTFSKAATKANRDRSERLATGASYHYKDVDAGTGYGGNTILLDLRQAVLFADKKSLGVIFASHFELYPYPTLALEFSILQFINSQWSTGQFVQGSFLEKEWAAPYRTHLADINRWAELNTEVVDKLRHKWYTRATRSLGPGAASQAPTHITQSREDALRAELDGRTGETDSEEDNAVEEDAEDV
ncbi:hypothetical protein C8R47DRAFT_1227757 [Mycena vitilis]|nr:hypothetical protein C8R47DRAFT_1227757 [Mycena vitilis]